MDSINEAYLLLGGNLGFVRETFLKARKLLEDSSNSIVAQSPIYCSEAWGFTATTFFLNQVFKISTYLDPYALLECTSQIEKKLGRVSTGQNGYASRVLDIDILFYNDLIIDSELLTIPHPRLHLRKFALFPMCDLIPDLKHPILRKTIRALTEECNDLSFIKRVDENPTTIDSPSF